MLGFDGVWGCCAAKGAPWAALACTSDWAGVGLSHLTQLLARETDPNQKPQTEQEGDCGVWNHPKQHSSGLVDIEAGDEAEVGLLGMDSWKWQRKTSDRKVWK